MDMKRFVCLLTALLMVLMLPTVAQAEDQLSVTVKNGDTVYVTVVLNQVIEGTTMGVSCSLDTALLKPVIDECKWEVEGLLSDFNDKGMGVWTTDKAMKLEGDMVTLAFRPLTDQPFSTDITCTLIVKNGGDEVGRFSVVGTVTLDGKQTVETQPVESAATVPETPATESQKTQPTFATEGATQPTGTMPSVGATETFFYSYPTYATEDVDGAAPPNNSWLLWALGIVVVGAAVAVVLIVKKKKA